MQKSFYRLNLTIDKTNREADTCTGFLTKKPYTAMFSTAITLRTPKAILALVLREMTTTYGRSPGGYLWAIIEPVAAISLMAFVFSLALRSPSLGTSFILFYASAFLPFTLFIQTSNRVAAAIKFSSTLLRYPSICYIDAIIARFVLILLTQIMVSYILLSLIITVLDLRLILDLQAIVLAMVLASFLGLGIGCLNCFLISLFPIWESIWGILISPLFILSCILFIFEEAPSKFQPFIWANPLSHISGIARSGYFSTYDAYYASPAYVCAISGITMALGLVLLNRYYRDIINDT